MIERKHPRFAVKVPVYISVLGRVFRKSIRIESSDMSAGGLAFETSLRIPLDSASRVMVAKLGDLPPTASIEARVAHRKQDPVTGRYTVGLEFTRLSNVTQEELIARIEDWAAAHADPPEA